MMGNCHQIALQFLPVSLKQMIAKYTSGFLTGHPLFFGITDHVHLFQIKRNLQFHTQFLYIFPVPMCLRAHSMVYMQHIYGKTHLSL